MPGYKVHFSEFTYRSINHPTLSPVSHVSCVLTGLSLTHTHACMHALPVCLITAIISTWMETKFDKATNDKCDLGNSLFPLSQLRPRHLIHHILIMSLPNVFSWDLLFHISRLTKRPAITVCRCYRGYNIYSHMMASQGDQEVGFSNGDVGWLVGGDGGVRGKSGICACSSFS